MTKINAKVKYGKLKNLVEEMSKTYSVKVGILADNGNQPIEEDLDLAGLGAIQEFGCTINVTDKMRAYLHFKGLHLKQDTTQIHIPARSFLVAPLMRTGELKKEIQKNFYEGESLETVQLLVNMGDEELLKMLAYAVGIGAIAQINRAFETSGFGEWQANNPFTIKQKGSSKPLINTGNLASHITYEVSE